MLPIEVISGLTVEHVLGKLEFTGFLWYFLHVHGFVLDLEEWADFVAGGDPGDEGDQVVEVGFLLVSKVWMVDLLMKRREVGRSFGVCQVGFVFSDFDQAPESIELKPESTEKPEKLRVHIDVGHEAPLEREEGIDRSWDVF